MLFLLFQILQNFWTICNCGPYHMLKEILFCRKRKWKILYGIRHSLERQGYRGTKHVWKKTLCCRREDED